MTNYMRLTIGDKVELWIVGKKICDTTVTRVTKRKVVVSHKTSNYHEQCFRRKDGLDIGPVTHNVYFLKFIAHCDA